MKRIITLVLITLMLLPTQFAEAQNCTGVNLQSHLTATCGPRITTGRNIGDYQRISVRSGRQYLISTENSGANNTTLTLRNSTGVGTLLLYSDINNVSGDDEERYWTATFTGSLAVIIRRWYGHPCAWGVSPYAIPASATLRYYCVNGVAASTAYEQWHGVYNTNWYDGRNWECGQVPGTNTSVVLDAGAIRDAYITSGTANARNLVLEGARDLVFTGAGNIRVWQ